ncbi:hypothetical protein [Ramlibacter sp.]|uniref:phage major capsid protein n=1 Tax=Ramlibacter sp. TaxID=1917967 RepID=UPI003D12A0B7
MKLALLIAALAAAGGVVGREQVDAHMREAQAAPERDFRSLIDMARGAVDQVVNLGKLPGERRYVSIEAMYADRIVIELDGKHWQYSYSLKPVNGVETMVLETPVQVVGQFVPVTAPKAAASLKEAVGERLAAAGIEATFVEAADGSIEVTLIKAGASGNGNYYPDTALKESVALFEGVRVFAKGDVEHLKGGGKDVRNLIGGIYGVKFVEGQQADTGRLVGTFKPLDPADPVVTKMTSAVQRGMQGLMGLSIDANGRTKKRVQGGKSLREAIKFTKVNSVDLIVEPGAGGGLDRLTEAAADPEGEKTMPLWKQRLLEAIKAKDVTKHATINPETITDDELVKFAEAMGVNVVGQADPLREAHGDDAPVTRADLQMLQARQAAAAKITASKLPQPAKDRLQADFAGRERFVEADVDKAIQDEGAYVARFTESGAVRVPVFGAGSIQVGDRSVQVKDMLDAFFDRAHANHRDVQSFKECYIEITGDRRVTGLWKDVDRSRLAESLGGLVDFREAIDSSTFADALGNTITRRMQAIFTGLTDLQAWRKVAVWGPVSDFRTQERARIGGYGNLPTVAESGSYTALSSPGDDKTTYAVTKRGGKESVTLETIKNDDVRVIRQIPQELALAAANTLFEFVFDFFRTNPTAYDTVALYHASHGNLRTAALDATEFAAHRLAMVKQTRAGSSKRMGVNPKTVLVPFELQETAFNLFVRNQNLDKTYVQSINPEVITVPYWTDANDWVTVADPNILPVIEIGFLDGKEDPELFVADLATQGSLFTNDKIDYKIRHIYGGADLVDGYKATTKAVVA